LTAIDSRKDVWLFHFVLFGLESLCHQLLNLERYTLADLRLLFILAHSLFLLTLCLKVLEHWLKITLVQRLDLDPFFLSLLDKARGNVRD
jgi:hypothetical protein